MFPLFILTIEDSEERSRWEKLYTMYQDYMYQIAFSILKNRADAEDVVNQTFMKMISNGIDLNPADKRCKVYLGRAANNNAINLYRRNRHFEFTDYAELSDVIGFEPDLSGESDLVQAIAKLPNLYKDPMMLYYYGNYKTKEIAKMLGRNTETVQRQLSRGRELLRTILLQMETEEGK